MNPKYLFCVLLVVAGAPVAAAQAISESEVTEQALINALTRPAEPARSPKSNEPDLGASRGILVTARTPAEPRASVPAGASTDADARSALLLTFEPNSATLTGGAKRALSVVARAMNSEQLKQDRFVIEGHADRRGNPDRNLVLSQERAESVRAYLVIVGEIDVGRLKSVGKGDREPLNADDPASPENRRVTFATIK